MGFELCAERLLSELRMLFWKLNRLAVSLTDCTWRDISGISAKFKHCYFLYVMAMN